MALSKLGSFLALGLVAGCQATKSSVQIDTTRSSRSFGFVYKTTVQEVTQGAREVRVWVPVPIDTNDQAITNVKVAGSCQGVSFAIDPEDLEGAESSGSMGDISWMVRDFRSGSGRSLCVTAPGPVELEMTFDVTRYESHGGGNATGTELRESLEPDRMIPLDGKVATMAASLPTDPDSVATGRILYDHTLERMKYDKPEGGDWGRGDAEWACNSRYGNCTDFHSYFMGLARTKGIPARFEMGFAVPGGDELEKEIGGYHCWAFFWSEQESEWIPVDISEADKHPEKAEYFFGTLDYDRVTMSEGRDLLLEPAPSTRTLNFLVYPYVEVDGVPSTKVAKSFKRLRR